MKKIIIILGLGMLPVILFAQTGHLMQGIGAANMSMGGASTAQPLDINGALQWNPAAISAFDKKILSVNAGLFFSSPSLSSTVPTSEGPFTGVTKDDRGASVMPALAMVWGKKNSKHTFEQFSIGFAPTFNYSSLELAPNPLSSPSTTLGYPVSDKASALGFGGQFGIFYNSGKGIKLGASYKTPQTFGSFDFNNKYLDGTTAPNVKFEMNYPAILSAGIGYSKILKALKQKAGQIQLL